MRAVPPAIRPGLTLSTLHSATECAQQAALDGSKSRAGRHLRKSDAFPSRTRSGSIEPVIAFAGRQGYQQDQQDGILRDKSFAKMDLADFRLVVDVHLMGAAVCSKAVWDQMRERRSEEHQAELQS